MESQLVYESPTWKVYFWPDASCLHFVFSDYTKSISSEEYIGELKQYIDCVNKYRPKTIYADTREFYFTIGPDTQEFIAKYVLALYGSIGVTKHAVLVSSDLFTSISVEQTMEENKASAFENKYFESPEEAEKWLGIR